MTKIQIQSYRKTTVSNSKVTKATTQFILQDTVAFLQIEQQYNSKSLPTITPWLLLT